MILNYPTFIATRDSNLTLRKTGPIFLIYQRLLAHYGPQGWWPGETPLEIMVGAVLTQNTAWRNVEKAINNLKTKKLLSLEKLIRLPVRQLAKLVQPSGFYNLKAHRLHNLLAFIAKKYQGDLGKMKRMSTQKLRKELLSIKGVGEETADSILLYAFHRPVFVIDAYTKRIFARHNFFSYDTEYSAVQQFFSENLPKDVKIYNEYHALIVRLAKEHCRKEPICLNCPLATE